MLLWAKYSGRCAICNEMYAQESEIWWEPGEKPVHRECHEDEVTNEASPVKPVQAGTVVRYKPHKIETTPKDDTEF